MALLRSILLQRGPFWLLVAAWLCANTPQIASWHVILWAKDARHFTHQSRLHHDVAALLRGEAPGRHASPRLAALPQAAEQPPAPAPAIPSDAIAKKIPLSLESSERLPAVASARHGWPESRAIIPRAPVADVPCPPPRAG